MVKGAQAIKKKNWWGLGGLVAGGLQVLETAKNVCSFAGTTLLAETGVQGALSSAASAVGSVTSGAVRLAGSALEYGAEKVAGPVAVVAAAGTFIAMGVELAQEGVRQKLIAETAFGVAIAAGGVFIALAAL